MDYLIYEDDPWVLKGSTYWERKQSELNRGTGRLGAMTPYLIVIFIVGLIVGFFLIEQFLIVIIVTLFFMAVIGVALMPTKYQIFNDRIRIILGYILHFDIPFRNVGNATAATSKDLGVLNLNFINSYSNDNVLQITRKHGVKINITPGNRTLFLENLNKSLADWR